MFPYRHCLSTIFLYICFKKVPPASSKKKSILTIKHAIYCQMQQSFIYLHIVLFTEYFTPPSSKCSTIANAWFPEESGRSNRLHNKPLLAKGKAALVHSQRQFLFSISLPLNILLTSTPFNWAPSCGPGEHIRDDVSRWLSEDLPGNICLRSPGQPREIMPVKQSTGAKKKKLERRTRKMQRQQRWPTFGATEYEFAIVPRALLARRLKGVGGGAGVRCGVC